MEYSFTVLSAVCEHFSELYTSVVIVCSLGAGAPENFLLVDGVIYPWHIVLYYIL